MKQKKILHVSIELCLALICCFHVNGQGAEKYIPGQEGPSGGSGGQFCDTYTDYKGLYLATITIRWHDFIESINLTYDGHVGDSPAPPTMFCGGTGGDHSRGITLGVGEYIVRVLGKYGTYVDYLYVQTSGRKTSGGKTEDRYFEFGNSNSTAPGYFDYQAPEGMKIGNFIVRSGTYVDAIGVILERR